MHKPTPLDVVEYRLKLATSLWEVILDMAHKECSETLVDLLCMACDINQEAWRSLELFQNNPNGGGAMSAFFELRNEAENALNASKAAREVLLMWIELTPYGEKYESESIRIGVVLDAVFEAISCLEKAVDIKEE